MCGDFFENLDTRREMIQMSFGLCNTKNKSSIEIYFLNELDEVTTLRLSCENLRLNASVSFRVWWGLEHIVSRKGSDRSLDLLITPFILSSLTTFLFFFLKRIPNALTKNILSSDTVTHSAVRAASSLCQAGDVTEATETMREALTPLVCSKLLPVCHTNRVSGQEGEHRFFLFFAYCWNTPEHWGVFQCECECVCAFVFPSHAVGWAYLCFNEWQFSFGEL